MNTASSRRWVTVHDTAVDGIAPFDANVSAKAAQATPFKRSGERSVPAGNRVFIEDNWHLPAMGDGASDAAAGSVGLMFNFTGKPQPPLFLSPNSGDIRTR